VTGLFFSSCIKVEIKKLEDELASIAEPGRWEDPTQTLPDSKSNQVVYLRH